MNDLLWLGSIVARMSLLSRALRDVNPVSPAQMVGEAMLGQNKNCVNFSFLVHVGIGPLNRNASEGFHPVLESRFAIHLVIGRTPCTSREKWTMFSGRVSSGYSQDDDMIETLAHLFRCRR